VTVRAIVLPFFVLSACVAGEDVGGLPVFSDTSAAADAGPVDEGNGLVGLVSGGMTDTGDQQWEYTQLECATGSYVLISTHDKFDVSERRAFRLARYVKEQRKAGTTGSLEAFFKASAKAGMKPLQNQFQKGWADESGCEKFYPRVKRDWPEMSDAEKAEQERQRALIASVVGVTVTKQ
jgi:hypothetical protein